MINLDQVKLLESKVVKAVEFIERLTKENAGLHKENADLHKQEAELKAKLAAHQKRIEELEVLFKGFKEDQGQIEEAILATLDKLSVFEKAMEKSLHENKGQAPKAKSAQSAPQTATAAKAAAANDIPDPLDAQGAPGAPEEGGELDIF